MNKEKEYILVIPPSGPCRLVPFASGIDKQNDQLWKLIGGFYETVACIGQDFLMLVDEEGVLKDYSVNPVASAAARYADVIVGTAVILTIALDDDGWEILFYGMSKQKAVEWLHKLSEQKHIPISLAFEPSNEGVV